MTPTACEVNFDGIVGPTHNYAGLAQGNVASQKHQLAISYPKQAAIEGLAKMKLMADLGVKQAVLPPQERPDLAVLRRLGFEGDTASILSQARRDNPALLAAACSASSMWAANAATVSPSADTLDRRVHFTPANLVSHLHRSIEAPTTAAVLRAIFRDESVFAHHDPLPACPQLGDEGAANHTRLCPDHGSAGVELFVYGRAALDRGIPHPAVFPARQTREASATVARLHRLDPRRAVFVQQNPAAIDAGVFHNDVISVGNENVFLYHSDAFADTSAAIDHLRRVYADVCGQELICLEVTAGEISVADAVDTYLFNSQLVTLPSGGMATICPSECQKHPATQAVLERVVAGDNPVRAVHFVDVRQSMQNGGGPACLRLRVALTTDELAKLHQGVLLNDALYGQLTAWVQRHYRDQLSPDDLADPKLLDESRTALDELTQALKLGSIYPFQKIISGR